MGAGRLSGTRSPATLATGNSTITLEAVPIPTGSCLPSPTPGDFLRHDNLPDDSHDVSQRRLLLRHPVSTSELGRAECAALVLFLNSYAMHMLLGSGCTQNTLSLSMPNLQGADPECQAEES